LVSRFSGAAYGPAAMPCCLEPATYHLPVLTALIGEPRLREA